MDPDADRYARVVRMTDSTHQATELDARLAEIDRRLQDLQGELAPDGAATETAPADSPAQASAHLDDQIAHLTALHTSLLASMTDVLGQLQGALGALRHTDGSELSISAGPFATLEEVHAFERELARLPSVREAYLRGYEGDDRAVIVVQLSRPDT